VAAEDEGGARLEFFCIFAEGFPKIL
jgi:hypothetical protein